MASSGRKLIGQPDVHVEVRTSLVAGAGRGLFVKREFDAGESIWQAKRPLIAALDFSSLAKTCSNCYGSEDDVTRSWIDEAAEFAVKACTQCKLLRFCSKVCRLERAPCYEAYDWRAHDRSQACQVAAWKRHHAGECKFLGTVPADSPASATCEKSICRALIQLLVMRKSKGIDDKQWADITSLEAFRKGDGKEQGTRDPDDNIIKVAVLACKDPQLDTPLATKLLGILRRNVFTLVSSTYDTLGVAFDLMLSRINHDCQPNACIVFDGPRVSLRSLRPITRDSEITISYIDNTEPFEQRQHELQDGWHFHCACDTCKLQATTWRDVLPLVDRVPISIQQQVLKATHAQPASTTDITNALLAHATSLRTAFRALEHAPPATRIQHLEHTDSFFQRTRAWPAHRQPRAAALHDLTLAHIEAGAFADAARCAAATCLVVDAAQLGEPTVHPLRTVHAVRVLQLLNSLEEREVRALPFDVGLVTLELVRGAVTGARRSHGEHSLFYRAVHSRFAGGLVEMATAMEHMPRQELEWAVKQEMSKFKTWAMSKDDIEIAEESLKYANRHRAIND